MVQALRVLQPPISTCNHGKPRAQLREARAKLQMQTAKAVYLGAKLQMQTAKAVYLGAKLQMQTAKAVYLGAKLQIAGFMITISDPDLA
ncbi:hypothetical protein KEM48_003445 [Puccinia striiformis f. sp. tritici PST-130]|nr:hypothetical protein KEM48_003445 [Puccinia striiformis f. sp. tritici PST-130]